IECDKCNFHTYLHPFKETLYTSFPVRWSNCAVYCTYLSDKMFRQRSSLLFTAIRYSSSKYVLLIGCENGAAGRKLGCEEAVRVMRQSHFLEKCKIAHKWAATIQETQSGRQQAAIPGVSKLARQLASTVHRWIMLNEHPVVIGGDHSCAIGTWSGLAAALRDKGNIGLIWLDAHLDAHTPDTSETGNVHGMPVAHLLGYGDKTLVTVFDDRPKLSPKNLVYIGSRSYEAAEKNFIDKLGVKIFSQSDVDKLGIEKVLNTAIEIVSKDTVGFGMSIDMDGFREEDAPAVGTPEAGGVIADDFLKAVEKANLDKLLVTELVEFLPRFDKRRRTEQLIVRIIEAIYGNKFSRKNEEVHQRHRK
uniref:Arginase n=2 Tax=Parascaris univalens TaxID=6257 RepID=A0A915ACX8_PARUN